MDNVSYQDDPNDGSFMDDPKRKSDTVSSVDREDTCQENGHPGKHNPYDSPSIAKFLISEEDGSISIIQQRGSDWQGENRYEQIHQGNINVDHCKNVAFLAEEIHESQSVAQDPECEAEEAECFKEVIQVNIVGHRVRDIVVVRGVVRCSVAMRRVTHCSISHTVY